MPLQSPHNLPNSYIPAAAAPPPPSPVQTAPEKPAGYHKEEMKNIFYTILLFIFAPVFALLMIMFVFQSYVVDGSSMQPTLENGNRVFILKLPKTFASIRGKDFVPTRNEIIVFKKPSDPEVQLIKRVIGLPGDRVVVNDNKITIYNSQHPNGFNPDLGTSYEKILDPTTGNVDINVGAGELFVAGDNRSPGGSLDSRSGLGLVPVQNIIGRLWIRYFPLGEFTVFSALKSDLLSYPARLLTYNL
ncbi:MAG: signal peptidase I [Candidatus Saccharibacteria bacterium]